MHGPGSGVRGYSVARGLSAAGADPPSVSQPEHPAHGLQPSYADPAPRGTSRPRWPGGPHVLRADGLGQDLRVPAAGVRDHHQPAAAAAASSQRVAGAATRARARADPRAGLPDSARGGKADLRVRPSVGGGLRRRGGAQPAVRAGQRRRHSGGDARPPHRLSRAPARLALADQGSGAGRGRPHARHGLRAPASSHCGGR
mmetsp:Transcript_83640/g.236052  ORF Transcript_83640/g.236052 Transcript_83640/m.236052 type:complete len:200 (-) Transcript_83640:805-1404(-)